MANERRKRKFINSWAQLSIAAEVVLHALLLLALISLLLFAPPFVTMLSDYSVEDHQAIAKDLFYLNASKWPLFVCLAIFIGFISVLFSHHLVGPAYKFQRALGELNERNLDLFVKLRKWDYFGEVENELNRHVVRLKDDMALILQHQQKAIELCRELKSRASPEKASQLEQELAAIAQVVQSYRGLPQS